MQMLTFWERDIYAFAAAIAFGLMLATCSSFALFAHTLLRRQAKVSMSATFAASAVSLDIALSVALVPFIASARPVLVLISEPVMHHVLSPCFSRLAWARSWASAETLAILLMIGCVERNPGPLPAVPEVLHLCALGVPIASFLYFAWVTYLSHLAVPTGALTFRH